MFVNSNYDDMSNAKETVIPIAELRVGRNFTENRRVL